MVTKQVAYEPVLIDGEPAEQPIETTIPGTRLGLGAEPSSIRKLEAKLRKDIGATKWREIRKPTMIICALCGNTVEREHATQKYCKKCQPIAKRIRSSLRVMRHRHKEAYPTRGKTDELILYMPYKNEIKKILVPALVAETRNVARQYIADKYEKKYHKLLYLQIDEIFTSENGQPHRRHVEIDTAKPVLGGNSK